MSETARFGVISMTASDLAQTFGILDESAYADSLSSGLAAISVPNSAVFHRSNKRSPIAEHVSRTMSDAFGQVDLSDLRLLSVLGFHEICDIRDKGSFLLDEIISLSEKSHLRDSDLDSVALALASDWRIICSELDRLHPGATRQKTKLGLYVSSQTVLPIDDAIEGISVILSGLASILTGGPEGQTGLVRNILDTL